MRRGFATRSASRCRSVFPPRSPIRSTIPMRDLVARYARTHGPFLTAQRREAPRRRRTAGAASTRGARTRRTRRPRRVPSRRRRARVVRRRRVAPAAPAFARRAAQGGRAGRRSARSLGSCLHGNRWARSAGASTVSSTCSACCRVRRSQRRCSRPTCCRLASPSTAPADLDALCTSGDVVWVGAGGLGANDGRIRLVFRDQAPMLVPPPADIEPSPTHQALLDHLDNRGASFWPELLQAVAAAGLRYDEGEVLAALWDLVWAGHVTNDSLAPVRAMVGGRSARRAPSIVARSSASGPAGARSAHPRRRDGGRSSRRCSSLRPSPTEASHAARHAVARALRRPHPRGGAGRRHRGRVRGCVSGPEGTRGARRGASRVLRRRARRRAVRAARCGRPAALVPRPTARRRALRVGSGRGPRRHRPGATVSARRCRGPSTARADARRGPRARTSCSSTARWPLTSNGVVTAWSPSASKGGRPVLRDLVDGGRYRSLEIRKVDGVPVRDGSVQAIAAELRAAGFVEGYRGLVYRGGRERR